MSRRELRQYVKDRDAAFLSLDLKKIRAFADKYGCELPDNEEVMWITIHKVICNTTSATKEQRNNSLMWLFLHGYSPDIFAGREALK